LDQDVQAADCNYNLVGTADLVFKCDGFVSVLMIDTLNSDEYHKAKKAGGLRRQIVELMTLSWLIEVQNGILLCENKDSNEHFMSHVNLYQPVIEGVKSKCSNLVEMKSLQKVPNRPYKDFNNNECNKCEYKQTCWTV